MEAGEGWDSCALRPHDPTRSRGDLRSCRDLEDLRAELEDDEYEEVSQTDWVYRSCWWGPANANECSIVPGQLPVCT